VLGAGPRRRPDQVAGLVVVALGAASAVHDRPDPVHRGVQPLAGGEVADGELDAVAGLVRAPAEHPHLGAGVPQPRHDQAPEGAGAAGHQER
jgi:hypothetical protein